MASEADILDLIDTEVNYFIEGDDNQNEGIEHAVSEDIAKDVRPAKRQRIQPTQTHYVSFIASAIRERINEIVGSDYSRRNCSICHVSTGSRKAFQFHVTGHFVFRVCICEFSHFDMREVRKHQHESPQCTPIIYSVCPNNLGVFKKLTNLERDLELVLDQRDQRHVPQTLGRTVDNWGAQPSTSISVGLPRIDTTNTYQELKNIAANLEEYADQLRRTAGRLTNHATATIST